MPAIVISAIIPAIQAIIKYAPELAKTYDIVRMFISSLFTGKLITAAQQDELFAWVDTQQAAWLAAKIPTHWLVEPDPEPAAPAPPTV